MNCINFNRKKLFTLIELIVVIVVLGILAAIVIPNISSFKEEAKETAILADARNIQTSVDMYSLENNGSTPTKETPTLGNPQVIELYGLKPDYLRDIPKNNGAKFWLDEKNTVWASTVDSPTKVEYSNGKLTWETVDGAELYKIYKSDDSVNASVENSTGIKIVDELVSNTGVNPEKTLPQLSKGTYLVTAVDEFKFESAPTKMGSLYKGYVEPDKDFLLSNKQPELVAPLPDWSYKYEANELQENNGWTLLHSSGSKTLNNGTVIYDGDGYGPQYGMNLENNNTIGTELEIKMKIINSDTKEGYLYTLLNDDMKGTMVTIKYGGISIYEPTGVKNISINNMDGQSHTYNIKIKDTIGEFYFDGVKMTDFNLGQKSVNGKSVELHYYYETYEVDHIYIRK